MIPARIQLLQLGAACLIAGPAWADTCYKPGAGEVEPAAPIVVSVSEGGQVSLGKIVRPSRADAVVSVNVRGEKAIPDALDLNDRNEAVFGDVFHAGLVTIEGEPGCRFRIDAQFVSPVITVTLEADPRTPVVFSSTGPGGRGVFVGDHFNLRIGAAAQISRQASEIDSSIRVTATYLQN